MSDTTTFTEPLADEAARREFAESLRENFNVCAGAGVGKTRAIVERIASLAKRRREEPDILSRLVVVTYGKLAAEELRVRTRDLLLARTERSAHGRQRLLADLRGAFFGTIHAFCLKVIAEHGRHLGLPAQPVLLEDRDEPELWARFTDGDAFAALKLPADELAAVTSHLTFEELLTLARRLDPGEVGSGKREVGSQNPEAQDSVGAPNPGVSTSRFPLPTSHFEAALEDSGGKNPKARLTTARHQETLRRWLADYADPAGRPFLALPEFKGGSGTFLEAVNGAFQPLAQWVDAAAGRLAATIARAWRGFRLERGVMTYRDMVFWCRRLLDDPAVLRRLRERGWTVILDEAQDTDGEMFAILSEITRPLDAAPFAWPEDGEAPGPEPGRFSFVGDEQQAIYRQRADPATYRRYVDAYREGRGGRRLEFSVTMRCPQRVIAAVNGLFGAGRLTQADCEFRALAPRPDCPEGGVWRLELPTAGEGDGEKVNQEGRIAAEGAAVADFLAERGPAGLGAARWSEVAILAPRIDWLEAAARALTRRGLPSSLLSQKRAARELPPHAWPAALLHVLVNPWDRWELIGVLREIFAVSDVELARWHRGAKEGLGFWPKPDAERLRAATGPGARRLGAALTRLRELRAALPGEAGAKGGGTLGRYVAFVLERSHLADRLQAVGSDAGALARLQQRALRAECDGLALRPWVRRLVEDLELPPPPAADGPDAVQLLTSYKAKGLEWPVVIPLGLGCRLQARSEGFPRVEREAGPPATFTAHFSGRTLDPVRAAREEARRREEFQRLLYVTITRARRLLVVPDGAALHGNRDPNLFGLARWEELDDDARAELFPAAPGETALPKAADGPEVAPPVPTAAPVTEFRDDPKRLTRAKAVSEAVPKRTLPSSLVHDAVDEARVRAAETTALGDDDETGGSFVGAVGGVDYGDWWHRTVEGYPWRGDDAARAEHLRVAAARLAETDPAAAERAAGEVARFGGSEFLAEALAKGKTFLPEAPFSHPKTPDEWVEGIMDLVVTTGAGTVWVVDWKTDRPRRGEAPDAQLARLAEKYGPQLHAYAEVFERSLGRTVARRLLYSTPLGRAVEVA